MDSNLSAYIESSLWRCKRCHEHSMVKFVSTRGYLITPICMCITKQERANRQIHVWEKSSDKEEHALPAYFSERWVNHEPLSPSARCFILLSEHSQVLTFFGPGFPLLCFMHFFLNNSRGFYILTWYFVKRNLGVKGILESLSTFNVNRTDLIWFWPSYS